MVVTGIKVINKLLLKIKQIQIYKHFEIFFGSRVGISHFALSLCRIFLRNVFQLKQSSDILISKG